MESASHFLSGQNPLPILSEFFATHSNQNLESVNLTIFFRQIADVWFRCDLGTSHLLDKSLRFILVSILMDILAQPTKQFREVALANLIIKVANIFSNLLP